MLVFIKFEENDITRIPNSESQTLASIFATIAEAPRPAPCETSPS